MAIGLSDKTRHTSTIDLAKSLAKVKLNHDLSLSKNGAPIHCLPPEILAKIFSCIPDDYVYDRWQIYPPHQIESPRLSLHQGSSADPMVLSHVCQQWREVAISTPILWSSINIVSSDYFKAHRLPLLKLWLERSADCPLTIRFMESVVGSAAHDSKLEFPQSPFTKDIMTLLVAEAQRWKTIDFSFSRRISPVLSDIAVVCFPVLETASISSRQCTDHDFGGGAPLERVWRAIHSSPSFRSGKWEMEYLEEHLNEIPWEQLTTINVTMTLHSLLEILPRCHNLIELRYTDPSAIYHPGSLSKELEDLAARVPDVDNAITHNLRHLSLNMGGPPNTILDRLTLPSLSSYDIQIYQDSQDSPHASSFMSLLARSKCTLKVFKYADPEDNAEDSLVKILSSPHMTSVAELDVRPPTTDVLVDLLKRTGGPRDILPRLEKLSLGPCSARNGALSGMVLSRQSSVDDIPSLIDLEVGRWDQHPIDLQCFEALLREGVSITV